MGPQTRARQLLALSSRRLPPPGPSARTADLDIGGGEGRVGRDLTQRGHCVVELDASPIMARAAITHPEAGAPCVIADAAALPLPAGVADCAVAFMSLQDVDAMEAAVAEVARVLIPGGRLVMAITHPVNTVGRFLPGPEDAFLFEGSWFTRRKTADTCERDGLTMTFHSEHRPLHDYMDALADAGFLTERIREVGDTDPASKWNRLPLFLHLRAVRS
jgi:SAM-dependent methyltransferase